MVLEGGTIFSGKKHEGGQFSLVRNTRGVKFYDTPV